jgi:hypothetical protein
MSCGILTPLPSTNNLFNGSDWLVACCAVYSRIRWRTFRRCLLPSSSGPFVLAVVRTRNFIYSAVSVGSWPHVGATRALSVGLQGVLSSTSRKAIVCCYSYLYVFRAKATQCSPCNDWLWKRSKDFPNTKRMKIECFCHLFYAQSFGSQTTKRQEAKLSHAKKKKKPCGGIAPGTVNTSNWPLRK